MDKSSLRIGSDNEEKEKQTYSLNPNINKRIKTKRIEDLRKQAVNNVKKSLSIMEGGVGFFG